MYLNEMTSLKKEIKYLLYFERERIQWNLKVLKKLPTYGTTKFVQF